ncbi:MAG: amidohydrolase/deacetylase family metallohydrolase [Anaerolineae bacterium]|nr:amidohydrolase/deacetylase family metallohydrolase [Anaerolineae bacterium]
MGLEGRRYDLIIRGGRVLDPAQGIDGIRGVAIAAGKVEAVEASIAPGSGTRVVDATGRLVTPGLIDLHAHLYYGATYLGIEPDAVCGPTGVTTVVDAGSAGANTFAGLRHFVVERSRTRVLPFLHVSSIGLATDLECRNLELVDVEKAVRCVEANRDLIGGIKVRANKMGVGDQSVFPVHLARDVADVTGLPLMVDMYYPPPSVEQVFPLLRPGDISTHMYKGFHGGLLRDGNTVVREGALAARDRGVLFDLGHGAGSFAWEVARPAFDLGFRPDTVSTDLHEGSVKLPDVNMPDCMAKMMALGASLEEVVRWSTANSAAALRRPDLGTLVVGGAADVTVLDVTEGEFTYYDVAGKPYAGRHHLRAVLTVCRGVITYEADAEGETPEGRAM